MRKQRVQASEEIRDRLEEITGRALELQWERWPNLRSSLDAQQHANMRDDTRYHLQFLASSLWSDERALYEDYVLWVERLFENIGLPKEWLTGSLEEVGRALEGMLEPASAEEAVSIIEAALSSTSKPKEPLVSFIHADSGLGSLAQRYLQAVLGGDRDAAMRAVIDEVESGVNVRDIYTYVLAPAQLELGRLWQLNRITVAQEHYSTAVTQTVMARLYPHVFSDQPGDKVLVAACVGRELHEVGVRMIADFFEMSGWNTHYLGANTPTSSLVESLVQNNADVLALSATMSFRVPEVADTISSIRDNPRTQDVKILVGGYPFNLVEDLWSTVGADAYASSAEAAIKVGDSLAAGDPIG